MTQREIEAKFELLDPTQLDFWSTTPTLASTFPLQPAVTVTQTDTYLDSAEYSLLRAGYALRVRGQAGNYLITLKSLNSTGDSLIHDRLELEGPVKAGENPLQMKHWPDEIRHFVKSRIDVDTKWQPLCTLQQTRRKRDVLGGAEIPPIAELSVDQVIVYGPEFPLANAGADAAQPTAQPITQFQEIEVELKPDQDAALIKPLAQALQAEPTLKPYRTSKFERALESISNSVFDGKKYVLAIQPTMHMAEACRLIWRRQLTHMLLVEAGVCHSDDDEYIHKMRVAIRRARVAARLFADYFQGKAVRRFDKILKRTGRLLGEVRDLDVARKKLEKFQAGQTQADLAELDDHWHTARKRARHALLAWLDSKKYSDFVADFARFCKTPGKNAKEYAFEPGEAPTPYQVRHVMPSLLVNRFERVRSFEMLFETDQALPASILHLLRIECKYMRYSLEFANHLLGESGEQLINALKGLQDHLGELNDAAVSHRLLASLPATMETEAVNQYATAQAELLDQLRNSLAGDLQQFLNSESRAKLAQAVMRI